MQLDFCRSLERREGLTRWRCGISGLQILLYQSRSAPPRRCVFENRPNAHTRNRRARFHGDATCTPPHRPRLTPVPLDPHANTCATETPKTTAYSAAANAEQSAARDDNHDLSHSATCFPKRRPFKCHICAGAPPSVNPRSAIEQPSRGPSAPP